MKLDLEEGQKLRRYLSKLCNPYITQATFQALR